MVVDALGRTLSFASPPRRIVSLVPSETHAVVELADASRVVGRTRYCVEPALPEVAVIGGTKDVDVDAVIALCPDLVLANREENARPAIEALIARGLPVHVSFPCSVADSITYLHALAEMLHVPSTHASQLERLLTDLACSPTPPRRVFVPIWNDPWMTFDSRAFASDVLELAGAINVFGDRPRRYPLAADLGRRAPLPPERVEGRDTRYPRITQDEIRERAPELVLLPDEPHEFTSEDADTLMSLGIARDAIRFVSGKDLFWYGAWLLEGLPRLRALLGGPSDTAKGDAR